MRTYITGKGHRCDKSLHGRAGRKTHMDPNMNLAAIHSGLKVKICNRSSQGRPRWSVDIRKMHGRPNPPQMLKIIQVWLDSRPTKYQVKKSFVVLSSYFMLSFVYKSWGKGQEDTKREISRVWAIRVNPISPYVVISAIRKLLSLVM